MNIPIDYNNGVKSQTFTLFLSSKPQKNNHLQVQLRQLVKSRQPKATSMCLERPYLNTYINAPLQQEPKNNKIQNIEVPITKSDRASLTDRVRVNLTRI